MTTRSVVLVAEDDVLVRNLVQTVLVRAGYSVLVAGDGEEALELSRRYQGDIHLLLSDVTMPRMDGFRLAERIREERPGTRALLVSGRLSSEIMEANAQFDFLRKPFVPDELKRKLREILERPSDGIEQL
jgi:CheY-like chemotaxis protein